MLPNAPEIPTSVEDLLFQLLPTSDGLLAKIPSSVFQQRHLPASLWSNNNNNDELVLFFLTLIYESMEPLPLCISLPVSPSFPFPACHHSEEGKEK